MTSRFGLRSLRKRFPTEEACLRYIFKKRHGTHCSCGGTFKLMKSRPKFECGRCSFQISPTAGTIFENTRIPLMLWFHVLMMFSNAKSGLAAKTVERDLEVTYKTAWRMLHVLRKRLRQSKELLTGIVETDLGYFGGKGIGGKYNERQKAVMQAKTKVFAAVARGKSMRAKVVPDGTAATHKTFLDTHVTHVNTELMTDGALHYTHSSKKFFRESVNHRRGEYVRRGRIHINSVESFWSHVKASVRGTHKAISPKHFQSYLDGFVFHHNTAHSDKERFFLLLDTAILDPAT